MTRAVAGVSAPAGMARHSDLVAFSQANLRLVRLRCRVHPVSDVGRWRDAGATHFVLQLLSPAPARRPTTPEDFVDEFAGDIERFLTVGVNVLEIHDEPNRVDRGLTVSWQDGVAFAAWFDGVVRCLHRRYGYELRIGFPALYDRERPHPDADVMDTRAAAHDHEGFLRMCEPALESADWVGVHLYWRVPEELRAPKGALSFLHTYLDRYPACDVLVTEFANVNPDVSPRERGGQYVELLTLLAQYERVLGVCGFPLRSSDPRHRYMEWVAAGDAAQGVVDELAERPGLPDRATMRFTWPTTSRHYVRLFGRDQQGFYHDYGMAGGHNGVDLGVADTSSGRSPVVAALDGTVTQVALDEEGYGGHVRIRSYGSDHEEITLLYAHLVDIEVSVGMLVSRGELLGFVAVPSGSPSEHLHLGMRVTGLHLPATRDWVNPRPYLEGHIGCHSELPQVK